MKKLILSATVVCIPMIGCKTVTPVNISFTPELSLNPSTEFWDRLAPHHAALENNFFDLRSVRALVKELVPPVLIVGAGQGLIVNELVKRGFATS